MSSELVVGSVGGPCPGQRIDVNGVQVHYEKMGRGPQPVLLMPGGTGTGRMDMVTLWEGMSHSKFTFIAWDPPGYGFSRPPERNYELGNKLFEFDADMAVELMKNLGYSSFAVVGWSDGGRAGLAMAVKYPSRVERLVTWGAAHVVTENQKKALEVSRAISGWVPDRRDTYMNIYGAEAQGLWNKHVNFYQTLGTLVPEVAKIRCPIFVLHGERDPVELSNAEHLCRVIADSRLHKFPEGAHNLHTQYPKEFNKLVESFLEESDSF